VRVVALTAEQTTAHMTWTGRRITEARRIDLLGRDVTDSAPGQLLPFQAGPVIDAGGSVALSLRPWEIATLRLTPDRPGATPS
jgi:hypothetical protein